MAELPDPPTGEVDDEGRHVHPYVRDHPAPDPSLVAIETFPEGEIDSLSHQCRLAFHAVEGLLQALTPYARALLAASIVARMRPSALDKMDPVAAVAIDRENPIIASWYAFEAMHSDRLAEVDRLLGEIIDICPGCGKIHDGEDHPDEIQPGAYVHDETGDSVRVFRVEADAVHIVFQVAPDRSINRVYHRDYFESHFVPADRVEIVSEVLDGEE